MKRSDSLRSLSEQHHYTLVLARNLRLAGEGKKPLGPVLEELERAWRDEIEPHFRAEEELLLPKCAPSLAERVRTEHAQLRRAVLEIDADPARAGVFGQALHDHIRFEERVVFPALESSLTQDELEELGRNLHECAVAHTCRLASG